ncbi:MAG: thiol reductase thioredoxin [Blastopirellula sp.]|nr:MAG: thiol reductase thioredoxin [Blastopirellula sp.]
MLGVTLAVLLHTATLAPGAYDYAPAFKAAEQGKPMLVLIGADWCPGCVSMKRSTMPALARAGKLKGVAYAEIDTDAQPELANKLMSGGSIPQLVLYRKTKKGWFRTRLIGAQSQGTVEALIKRALEDQKEEPTTKPVSLPAE